MDNSSLKKRLSTFKTDGGYLKNVPDELLVDILTAWETWEGATKGFYASIGTSATQMAYLMGRAKKLKREGIVGSGDFKEVRIESDQSPKLPHAPIILRFQKDKIIRFYEVDHLVEFLKKVA